MKMTAQRRKQLLIAAAVAAGLLIAVILRRRNAGGTSTSSVNPLFDPALGGGGGFDPSTGLPIGLTTPDTGIGVVPDPGTGIAVPDAGTPPPDAAPPPPVTQPAAPAPAPSSPAPVDAATSNTGASTTPVAKVPAAPPAEASLVAGARQIGATVSPEVAHAAAVVTRIGLQATQGSPARDTGAAARAQPTSAVARPTPPKPRPVTITANLTGGSANKKQGVFAIH